MEKVTRTILVAIALFGAAAATAVTPVASAADTATFVEHPNFVVIFCDDLGYGDLGTFGHPTMKTPHLDRMATEGQKWTNFYVAASVCTPSRAGLMTGRLPIRSGMCSSRRRVLFPDSAGGLPENEITIAEALRTAGYATACIGKWHLGHLPQFLPTSNGFDEYYGIPYSNDMDRTKDSPRGRQSFLAPKIEYFDVPLMHDTEIIERPADQTTITQRYTQQALDFIESHRDKPFFVYLPYSLPHVPLFRSDKFAGHSQRGLYGDVVEEIDWSVGKIMAGLHDLDLEQRTIVVFTSDNGPWLIFNEQGGSAGLLRGGKGDTFEGGMREPTIFWGPGQITPAVVTTMGATLDLLPTFCHLAGVELPTDRELDGHNLSSVLSGAKERGPRDAVFYYRGEEIYAVRKGAFKAHFITRSGYGPDKPARHDPPLLYHLDHDPSERYNVADKHPAVLADIAQLVAAHRGTLKPVTNQLEIRLKQN